MRVIADPAAAAPVLHGRMSAVFPEAKALRITLASTGNAASTFGFLPISACRTGSSTPWPAKAPASRWRPGSATRRRSTTRPSRWAGLTFPTLPLYNGNPNWFLPAIGGWYRLRDHIDRAAA